VYVRQARPKPGEDLQEVQAGDRRVTGVEDRVVERLEVLERAHGMERPYPAASDADGEHVLDRHVDVGALMNRNGAWIATTASECSSASSRNRRASRVSGSFVIITSTLLEPRLREEREHIVERRRDEAHRRAGDPRSAGGFGHGARW
jgi:hypothetical protein